MAKDILKMSRKELDRLMILDCVLKREVTQVRAAEVLGLSVRQIRRLVGRLREERPAGIAHRNRGKRSPRRLPDEMVTNIIDTVRQRYWDFGPTFAAEKLRRLGCGRGFVAARRFTSGERGKLTAVRWCRWMDRLTIGLKDGDRRWFLWAILMMPAPVFLGVFMSTKGFTLPMDSLERYIRRYGRSMNLYMDKHSTYKTTRQASLDELLRGQSAKTQFERACHEIGITIIHARSPQAKGRVERSFRTHQDRLIKEMRLEGISTMEQANEFLDVYLPVHNQKFSVQPFKDKDLHRRLSPGIKYRDIFCLKEKRTITNGFTIKWKNRLFLINQPTAIMRRHRVEVREHFDGTVEIIFKGRKLIYREITEKEKRAKTKLHEMEQTNRKGKYIPPPNHPWRRWDPTLCNNSYLQKIRQ
jgi:hypothetical protein